MGKPRALSAAFPKSDIVRKKDMLCLTMEDIRGYVMSKVSKGYHGYDVTDMEDLRENRRARELTGEERNYRKMKPVSFQRNYVVFETKNRYRLAFNYVDVFHMLQKERKIGCF